MERSCDDDRTVHRGKENMGRGKLALRSDNQSHGEAKGRIDGTKNRTVKKPHAK